MLLRAYRIVNEFLYTQSLLFYAYVGIYMQCDNGDFSEKDVICKTAVMVNERERSRIKM